MTRWCTEPDQDPNVQEGARRVKLKQETEPQCTWVVLSDLQGVFVRKQAWKSVLNFLHSDWTRRKKVKIILLGDIVDFYWISRYTKSPTLVPRLREEIHFVRKEILTPLDTAFPVYYVGGNHEDRLRRFAWNNAPELADLDFMTVPGLLQLDGFFTIHWMGFEPLALNKHLIAVHGDIARKHSCYSAKEMVSRYKTSVIVGHTHRMGMYYESGWAKEGWVGVENGHLMDVQKGQEAGAVPPAPNWQMGFTVVRTYKKNLFSISQAVILRDKVYFEGGVW
jgi:UDP-2,3-diacylglucosamine pyrophosphatase LpxH